ncbi:cell division protein ZapA [Candidatus Poribacteria bacterium]|nr:cell division protein ZapA [Candidatus Poribacteria bacterium]
MEQQEHELNKPIRFVILGTPYTIKPTEELTAEAITELVEYVKSLVESYLRKGFDEQRVPLLVAFHIADEKRRLQEEYELPLHRIVERLQFAIEEDTETDTQPETRNAEEDPATEEE